MTATPEPRDFQSEVIERLERLGQRLDASVRPATHPQYSGKSL